MGRKCRRVTRELVGDDSVFNLELVVVEVARSVIIMCVILKTKQRRFNYKNEMWKWESIQRVKYDFKILNFSSLGMIGFPFSVNKKFVGGVDFRREIF